MQGCHSQPYYDTAEYTHLQRLDSADRGDGPAKHMPGSFSVGKDVAMEHQHGADCRVHYKIGNYRGKGGYLFFLLCHTD